MARELALPFEGNTTRETLTMDPRAGKAAGRRCAGWCLPMLVMLLACCVTAAADIAPDPAALAARIHQEVNLAREREGLSPLAWHGELAAIAQTHSADMVGRDYFSHASPEGTSMRERYAQAAYECAVQVGEEIYVGAENIAMHTLYRRVRIDSAGRRHYDWLDDAALARKVVNGWLQSAGHRQNILAPHWQREGIGLAFNADYEVLITQNFC